VEPQRFHPSPSHSPPRAGLQRRSAQVSPACRSGPGVGQTERLLLQPPRPQTPLAILSATSAPESCRGGGDVGLGERGIIYPTLTAAPRLLGYSCFLGETRSGGRAGTASRIHLPLTDGGSPNTVPWKISSRRKLSAQITGHRLFRLHLKAPRPSTL